MNRAERMAIVDRVRANLSVPCYAAFQMAEVMVPRQIEAPSNWWTPLLSSGGSGKVSNEPGTASIYG